MKNILAVDVDLTVVDTLSDWVTWYNRETGHILEDSDLTNFKWDVGKLMKKHESPETYWKNPSLYDSLKPIKNSVEVLQEFKEKFDIIFVSSCFAGHVESKINFIRKYFPFNKGFISTHEKKYVYCDIIIDDYSYNLDCIKEFNNTINTIQYKTILNQDEINTHFKMNWEDISLFLKEIH